MERGSYWSSLVLNLALVESALQIVPREIQLHPQIKRYAERRMKKPNEVLLDRAFHHSAMQSLARTGSEFAVEKMGRPDIVHSTLLQLLETPLNWENQLRVFVHTQDDHLITINPKIRLPKNYVRFVGLMEQLAKEKRVPETGVPLMQFEKGDVRRLIHLISPSEVVGFTVLGQPMLMRTVADHVGRLTNPLVLIGGFPRGHFRKKTTEVLNLAFKVDRNSLDAWIVGGRFVYDFEWAIGVAQQRVRLQE